VTFGDATWDATNLQAYIDLYGGTAISETADAAGTASMVSVHGAGCGHHRGIHHRQAF
jgi:hypothetical protein